MPCVAALMMMVLAAGTPAEELSAAKSAEAELDYQRAKILLVGLLDRTDLSEQQSLEAHFLAGQIERILENDTEARLQFMSVLNKQPDWVLAEETPPKVRTFFELVREEVKAQKGAEAERAAREAEMAAEANKPIESAPPVLGAVVAGGGAVVMAAGLVAGVTGEMMFAQTDTAFEDRAAGRTLAVVGWAGAVVGVVVGAAGVALAVMGE